MKRVIAVLVLFTFIFSFAFSEETVNVNVEPEPIAKEEIPDWAKYLRRFEIVSLGSLPFTVLLATTGYTTYRWIKNGFDSNYTPNPFAFTSSAANVDTDEQKIILTTALVTSAVLGIVDISIYIAKREKAKKANAKILLPPNVELSDGEKTKKEAAEPETDSVKNKTKNKIKTSEKKSKAQKIKNTESAAEQKETISPEEKKSDAIAGENATPKVEEKKSGSTKINEKSTPELEEKKSEMTADEKIDSQDRKSEPLAESNEEKEKHGMEENKTGIVTDQAEVQLDSSLEGKNDVHD